MKIELSKEDVGLIVEALAALYTQRREAAEVAHTLYRDDGPAKMIEALSRFQHHAAQPKTLLHRLDKYQFEPSTPATHEK